MTILLGWVDGLVNCLGLLGWLDAFLIQISQMAQILLGWIDELVNCNDFSDGCMVFDTDFTDDTDITRMDCNGLLGWVVMTYSNDCVFF